jgi:hypothetical protein
VAINWFQSVLDPANEPANEAMPRESVHFEPENR